MAVTSTPLAWSPPPEQLSIPATVEEAILWLRAGHDLYRAEPHAGRRLGALLAAARRSRGLSQAGAAMMIGVERGVVTRVELGNTRLDHHAIPKLRGLYQL